MTNPLLTPSGACSVCYGNGRTLAGQPCPCGCPTHDVSLATEVVALKAQLATAQQALQDETHRADQAEAQLKRLTDAVLQFRNEPLLGRAHGIRRTEGYGAMQAALFDPPVPTLEEVQATIARNLRRREADRARFPDPEFNRWLDDPISHAGHTVWDTIKNIVDAWHGWDCRDSYRDDDTQPRSVKAEYDQLCADGEDPDPIERLRFFLALCLKGANWQAVEPFIDALRTGPAISTAWIRPADKLPDDGQYVIVFDPEAATIPTWPARYDATNRSFSAGGGWFELDEVAFYLVLPMPAPFPTVLSDPHG